VTTAQSVIENMTESNRKKDDCILCCVFFRLDKAKIV
jgi:hypothetical protein